MTRIEALRTLLRYMPERSIHITESLDSSYHLGDRRDNETVFVTINPGITRTEPECFTGASFEEALHKALSAVDHETAQSKSFAALNAQ